MRKEKHKKHFHPLYKNHYDLLCRVLWKETSTVLPAETYSSIMWMEKWGSLVKKSGISDAELFVSLRL